MKKRCSLTLVPIRMPAAIVALVGIVILRAQAVPTLDANFRPVITRIGGSISAAAVQADGKLILAGGFNAVNGVARNGIARLGSDGTLDPTFDPGAGACCAPAIGQTQTTGPISAIALQTGGKVVIGVFFSTISGTPRNGLARLNADGTLDLTFNPGPGLDGGPGSLPAGVVSAIVVQPDGKLLIGGSFSGVSGVGHAGIARLEANGSVDTSFNPGLGVMDDQGRPGQVAAVALLSNGQVLIGGNFSLLDNAPRAGMARLSTVGGLDPAFDPGISQLDSTLPQPSVDGLVVQPDGKIVFSGSFRFVGVDRDADFRFGLARFNPDTTLDVTFNPPITEENPEKFRVFGRQGDGKIIAYHEFTDTNGNQQRAIARVNADGSLDSNFGVVLQPGIANGLQVRGAIAQADGKWVVTGNFAAGTDPIPRGVVRINTGGGLEASFSPRPELSEELATHIQAVAVQRDGKVLIGGTFNRINGIERGKLARFNSDGTLDTGFVPVIEPADPQNYVAAILIQGDGRIIIGGSFTKVNGADRNSAARLNENGSLDGSFDIGSGTSDPTGAGPIGRVLAIAVQGDGKVILGGDFAGFNGQGTPWLVRLNPNGSVDSGLASGLKCLNCDTSEIRNVAVLSTGHIMISGVFNRISGVGYNGLARLLPDGSQDLSFITPAATDDQPGDMVVGNDDKTVVTILSSDRSRLVRLNADGTLDREFKPGDVLGDGSAATPVSGIKIDTDGRIIISGGFASVGPTPRHGLARLNTDGSLDADFDAGSGFADGVFSAAGGLRSRVAGLGLQGDGGIIVGGNFAVANGQVRLGLARFQAERPNQGGGSRPRLQSPTRAADGTFSMTVSGEAGRIYQVEVSTDLRSWSAIGSVTGAATPQPFSDAGAKNLPYRFYRAAGQ